MGSPVIAPFRITSEYGPRTLNGVVQSHNGLDIVTGPDNGPAWNGDRSVIAVAPGVVIFDKDNYDHSKRMISADDSAGNFIIVQIELGGEVFYVRYLHLGENFVSVGDQILEGDRLGVYGDYGYSYGPHLHIDLWDKNWNHINPHYVVD